MTKPFVPNHKALDICAHHLLNLSNSDHFMLLVSIVSSSRDLATWEDWPGLNARIWTRFISTRRVLPSKLTMATNHLMPQRICRY